MCTIFIYIDIYNNLLYNFVEYIDSVRGKCFYQIEVH
jgi:hypothetical protein